MSLDPQAKALLDAAAQLNMPELNTLSPAEARERMTAMRPPVEGEPVSTIENRSIPGPAGDLPVRVYRPAASGPLPALVFYHGGGWVVGDLEYQDIACRYLANHAPCVVVSVDYRLAPEHKFPAAPEDCYAAARWVAEHGASIGADPSRIAVGGDSAGGNLAAAVALMARDRGGPRLVHQLLVYPVTDHNLETGSYLANAEGYMLTRESMRWFWDHYIRTAADGSDPIASPLRASDLRSLPAATIFTAEFDPLRDEGEAYAARLGQAGVSVSHTRFDGMIHGFFAMSHVLDQAKTAHEQAAKALAAAFSAVPA